MSNPPPELAWIGPILSVVAILATIINFIILWRNRRRIEFRTISARVYYEPWKTWEIEKAHDWPGPDGNRPPIKEGDCRRAFIVVEIAVKNEYPVEVTVGRFMIDNWMFSDRYVTTGLLYPFKRDYRVFDLYGGDSASLETYVKVPPKGSHGLRIEVLEETDGPDYKSSHSRYVVTLPQYYKVEFLTDVGRHQHRVRFAVIQGEYRLLDHVHHWSDLLPPAQTAATSYSLPLGVEYSKWRTPWHWRFRNWYRIALNWMLYGKAFHLPGQPNRLSRMFQRFKRVRPASTDPNTGSWRSRKK